MARSASQRSHKNSAASPAFSCSLAISGQRALPPAIRAWRARRPRFHTHFTPTGSSWINQVERWFSYLTTQLLQRSAYKNVPTLEADIRGGIDAWNADPKPFVWTKTAEDILTSLAKYLERTSDVGH